MRIDGLAPAALETFRRHRLRTTFSAAGVALAVAVALATVAVNEGARRAAVREVERLGATTIVLRPRADATLSVRDLAPLAVLDGIAAAAPTLERRVRIEGPRGGAAARVQGVTAAFPEIRRIAPVDGRFLRGVDDETRARVCVLDSAMARHLFAHAQPVGAFVRIDGAWFRVVGTVTEGEPVVFVPLSALTARRIDADPGQAVSAIWVRAQETQSVATAAAAVRAHLTRSKPAGAAFDIVVAQDLLRSRDATQRLFAVIGAVMAVLLALLGGSAIANMMLTAVVERSFEIGLRRAVGATRRDIARQFLVEAVTIAGCGAAAGVAIGVALSRVTASYSGWPTHLSPAAVPPIVLVAVILGLLAGVLPAIKASRVQPIDALMHG